MPRDEVFGKELDTLFSPAKKDPAQRAKDFAKFAVRHRAAAGASSVARKRGQLPTSWRCEIGPGA